ncbi:MAG: hypothetical protein QXN36_07070 [Candidatus Bathyarchaeia archaeon]
MEKFIKCYHIKKFMRQQRNLLITDDLLILVGSIILCVYGFDVPKNMKLIVDGNDPYFTPRIFNDANMIKLMNLIWIAGIIGIIGSVLSLSYKLITKREQGKELYIFKLVKEFSILGVFLLLLVLIQACFFNFIFMTASQKELFGIWFGESFLKLFLGACLISAGILLSSLKPISWRMGGKKEDAKHQAC